MIQFKHKLNAGLLLLPISTIGVACSSGSDKAAKKDTDLVSTTLNKRAEADIAPGPIRFKTLNEMVKASDVIVRGSVVDIGPGYTVGDPPGQLRFPEAQLVIDEVLKGDPSLSKVSFYSDTIGSTGNLLESEGIRNNKIGDYGIYYLSLSRALGFYSLISDQGAFIVGESSILVPKNSQDPLGLTFANRKIDDLRSETLMEVTKVQ